MILKRGSSGHSVEVLEEFLGLDKDGIFGPEVEAAVISYQKSRGLTPDGIVGPNTQAAMLADYNQGISAPPVIMLPGTPPVVAPPSSGSGKLYGVDIYHEDEPNFPAMKAGGLAFCFVKASQAAPDPKFVEFFHGSKAAGINKTGAYHFMNWGVSGSSQYALYKSCIAAAGFDPSKDALMIDWEYKDGRNPTTSDVSEVKDFSDEMRAEFPGKDQILYLSDAVYLELVAMGYKSFLDTFVIFVAEYGVSKPKGNVPYTFWQTAEDAHVPGLGNEGDSDVFLGSIDDLNKL